MTAYVPAAHAPPTVHDGPLTPNTRAISAVCELAITIGARNGLNAW